MRFSDIKQFPRIYYSVNQSWTTLDEWLDRQRHDGDDLSRLNLNPDFQRGHVWTKKQQIEYVEFMLSGGTSGRNIYFNHPGWMSHFKGEFVLVDGLQRITAAQAFMHNEIPAFGSLYQDYEDEIAYDVDFIINVAKLQTRKDVLNWYILMNSGGTPHSQDEIERVKRLKESE
jgi:uncharacterized protein with ParB-like and HNH nuclease domain